MSRKETAAQQPVGRRRSERRQRQAPRDSEASAGAGLGFQVRRGPGPTFPGPPPRGTSHLGWGGRGGPGPRAGRGGLRPGPPALSWIQSLHRFRRKTPVESATGNFSLPHPSAITEFKFRVCTVVLALGSGETGASPGWVRGSPRAETESPGPGTHHVQGAWRGRPETRVSYGPLSGSGGRRVLRRWLRPGPCHLGPLPTGPLCLVIPGRRKPAGGT